MTHDFLLMSATLCENDSGKCPRQIPKSTTTRLWISIALLVVAADVLLYDCRVGVSATVMGILAITALTWNRPKCSWDSWSVFGMALILFSLVQSAIAVSFSNFVVLFALFSVAMVDSNVKEWRQRPASLPVSLGAWLRCFGRWPAFAALVSDSVNKAANKTPLSRNAWRIARMVLPALMLLVPFLFLFNGGNALAANYLSNFTRALSEWLSSLEFPSIWRILFWFIAATGALTFLWPSLRPDRGAKYTATWKSFNADADVVLDKWRTWSILALLNVLFLWANILDARFLWLCGALPAGVTYSSFVHEGIWSLAGATVLSAVTLTIVFQQNETVSRARVTRYLALLWIAQNLVLISSVFLRLMLYVDAYQLTVLRIGVAAFLCLTTLGFILLSLKVIKGKSLNWLLLTNGVAVFSLFYIAQFVDVSGYVAKFNTERWLSERTRILDISYLRSLGPSAWPSLAKIESAAPLTCIGKEAKGALDEAKSGIPSVSDWRSWQWRRSTLQKEVFPK